MKTEEKLLWILDGSASGNWDEEENRKRISFVHSLGQKCDCVGWSELDLSSPESDSVLDEIARYCVENGWRARGYYTRTFLLQDSEWYRLNGESFKDSELSDSLEITEDSNGATLRLSQLKAYALHGTGVRETFFQQCVPDTFRRACDEKGIKGLRYCWLRDVGKYRGVQYFAVAPDTRIPRMLCDRSLSYEVEDASQLRNLPIYISIQSLGGKLPRVAEVFTKLDITLPKVYLKEDMPDTDFAYGYLGQTFHYAGKNDILIRGRIVKELISAKVLKASQVQSVLIADNPLPGFQLMKTEEKPFPSEKALRVRMEEYAELMGSSRPTRVATEKAALQALRNARKQRKEDFNRGMSPKQRELLTETEYAALAPYYAVCDGGFLNDEYRLFSYRESIAASQEFAQEMDKEELQNRPPRGTVIAGCADGDRVILTQSNQVLRVSHETPEVVGQWNRLPDFFLEAVS